MAVLLLFSKNVQSISNMSPEHLQNMSIDSMNESIQVFDYLKSKTNEIDASKQGFGSNTEKIKTNMVRICDIFSSALKICKESKNNFAIYPHVVNMIKSIQGIFTDLWDFIKDDEKVIKNAEIEVERIGVLIKGPEEKESESDNNNAKGEGEHKSWFDKLREYFESEYKDLMKYFVSLNIIIKRICNF